MNLELYKYYIVELSYFKGNPIHKSIVFVKHEEKGKEIIIVFKGFECEEVRVNDLNYFNIISEIVRGN